MDLGSWNLDRVYAWAHAQWRVALAQPPEVLLPIIGALCALVLVLLIALWRARRKRARLRREFTETTSQMADLQAKYESEVKWRLAGEGSRPPPDRTPAIPAS